MDGDSTCSQLLVANRRHENRRTETMSIEISRIEPATDVSPDGGAVPDPRSSQVAKVAPERTGGNEETRSRGLRGFARLDHSLVREIARRGGKAAHSGGTAHEFTSEEARIAGRKGGQAAHARRGKKLEGPDHDLLPRARKQRSA
jgi:general stress protein YciG